MFPDWVYKMFTGDLVDHLGIMGMQISDSYIIYCIEQMFKGLVYGITIIIMICLFMYDLACGHLPLPVTSGIICDPGGEWLHTGNRTIVLKNTTKITVGITQVDIEILDCDSEKTKNYKCKSVVERYNSFSNPVMLQPGESHSFYVGVNDSYINSYQFNGIERDIVNFKAEKAAVNPYKTKEEE